MSDILRFYRGEAGNIARDTLEDMMTWSHGRLEMDHDYIQWMFPSNEPSMMNVDAPTLTREDAQAFQHSPELRNKMFRAFCLMMDFFGYSVTTEEDSTDTMVACHLVPTEPTEKRYNPQHILSFFNHNMLRVTRILKSLRLCGHPELARAFWEALQPYKTKVSSQTWNHWTRAAEGDLWAEVGKNSVKGDLGILTIG